MTGRRPTLLTGARGQLGVELARTLAPLGEVVAADRTRLDLRDADALRRAVRELKPRLIVSAGAYTDVEKAEDDVATATAVNVHAPAVLAEEAHRIGALLVHFSTDFVFDGEKGAPYVETDAPAPLSVYGRTKLDGERAVAAATPLHMILRTSWLYSAHGVNFYRAMLARIDQPTPLRMVTDQSGSPTWCRLAAVATGQIASRFLPALDRPVDDACGELCGTYHFASRDGTSRFDWAAAIFGLWGEGGAARGPALEPMSAADFKARARRPRDARLDCSKLAHAFGIELPGWHQSLRLCVEEHRTSIARG